jgi:hypothetical protein
LNILELDTFLNNWILEKLEEAGLVKEARRSRYPKYEKHGYKSKKQACLKKTKARKPKKKKPKCYSRSVNNFIFD